MDSAFRLQDKTAVLTGATTNLGRAVAQALASYGVNVALVGPPHRDLQRLVDDINNQREIRDEAGRAAAIEVQMDRAEQLQDAVAKAAELFGGIDIFIDNSLLDRPTAFLKDFSLSKLDELLNINLRSSLIMTHKVSQFLKARKKGRILFLLQDVHRLGMEGDALSAITRTGLIHFAKSLAHELAAENVTVNCLALPPTEEYLLQKAPKAPSLQAAYAEVLKNVGPFRMIDAADLAQTICFLVSPLASSISGQTVSASGGLTTLS